ncbi:MAG: alpha/beta hydrolase [Xenococcus sp. (in: cyanobacteria)]
MKTWTDYYQHFNIHPKSVRKNCEPRIMLQDPPTEKAIILIHGLTDSPFFMEAIGKRFYQWGYNVFIPLLDGHGLEDPKKMRGVKLETWMKNVDFAIQEAKNKYQCQVISIGGLSTGGALSVKKMLDSPTDINGGTFLFSAALDIAGVIGNLLERLLRTRIILPILAFTEDKWGKQLIGDNPYRYARMDKDGARELSKLIYAIDQQLKEIKKDRIDKPLFVAHSEYDSAADIEGVEELIAKNNPDKTQFFRIGKDFQVSHASMVLESDVRAENGSPLEQKNPFFEEMMNLVNEFQKKHCSV